MGKPIVYCEICGKPISGQDVILENAFNIQNTYYCKECAQNLNLKSTPKTKKISRSPTKPKINFDEAPNLEIEQAKTQETFFSKHKKELTYFLYSFSILIIILSALFIVYKYAISTPTAKDTSAKICKYLEDEIKKKSEWDERSCEHILSLISEYEEQIKGAECENRIEEIKKQVNNIYQKILERKNIYKKLDEIDKKPPEEAIPELKIICQQTDEKELIQLNLEAKIEKLWELKKQEIDKEYKNTSYSLEYYEKIIDNFQKEYLDLQEYDKCVGLQKKNEIKRNIARYRDTLHDKFEDLASEYYKSLTAEILTLVSQKKCKSAYKKIIQSSSKYLGTNEYKKTIEQLRKYLKEHCSKKVKRKPKTSKKEEAKKQQPILPPIIHPIPSEKEVTTPTQSSSTQTPDSTTQNPTQQEGQETNQKAQEPATVVFNGKDLEGWKIINKNATWQVWNKQLYAKLTSSQKDGSLLYYPGKTFRNFQISLKYKIISGSFYIYFHMNPEKLTEKFSFLYLNDYTKTKDFATFEAKVVEGIIQVNAPQAGGGSGGINQELTEGIIGIAIFPGTEIYFKDIVIKEITKTGEELLTVTTVPLFRGTLKNWIKTGAIATWKAENNMIYGENTLEQKENNTIDLSTLSVLYYDDKNFKPEWTNFIVSFEFNIAQNGFLIFGKFPTEGSTGPAGVLASKKMFQEGKWYKAQTTVLANKITVKFLDDENNIIAENSQDIPQDTKGYFGFGILPGQKVYIKNIRLNFIK
jgi:hypothetical protein